MYAIIATGGKQYKVSEGDIITIEKLDAQVGDTVSFDKVLGVCNRKLRVGDPYLEKASVDGTVLEQGRGKKVIVYKYKRKTGYHKKNGHRQAYTKVRIDTINAGA
ncbi:MAG: 50S ribosomal protein L21 [Clostridiales bacterium]|nr:50S ribosomal protein L21 [Clostridiales bacterium]